LTTLPLRSLFAALFAASKNFPNYPGIASGTTMALFGLSPLLLSLIASNKFTNPDTGLDVTRFLRFLSTFAGAIHLIGAVNLRTPQPRARTRSEDLERTTEVNEQSRLLPREPTSSQVRDNGSTLDLLRDPYFWVLASILVVVMGPVSDRTIIVEQTLIFSVAVRDDHLQYGNHCSLPSSFITRTL
jgi:hypothetical protein